MIDEIYKHGNKIFYCPCSVTLEVLSGKWKTSILWLIRNKVNRFGQLSRANPGMNKGVLTRELRELERDGLISRKIFAEIPPRVEYEMTKLGRTIIPVLDKLAAWGKANSRRSKRSL
jgi:DNA-binding HxlR family transcriptional regulator